MTRKTLSAIVAALVLSASFAATADAATTRHHNARMHSAAKPVKATKAAPRTGEAAATDALNQQSLTSARGDAR